MMETRHCKFCNVKHPLTSEYWYRLEGSPRCKVQMIAKSKKRHQEKREEILAYQKEWREQNHERHLANHKRWREENTEYHRENSRKYYYENKDEVLTRQRKYSKENRPSINATRKKRLDANPLIRLAQNLRVRLAIAVRRGTKGGSAVRDLGCSLEEFKTYLEARFQPGMTWENYGKVWNIDHIRPLANYDLSDRQILIQLVHYTNLQPLFVLDNIKKSNKE